jgi:hypothetical protein
VEILERPMQHVYRPKRRVNGKLRVSRFWKGRYRLNPFEKPCDVALKTTDKSVAIQKLHGIVREKRDEQAGIVAPRSLRDGAGKSLRDHLSDFVADLRALGRDDKYQRMLVATPRTSALRFRLS